MTGPATDSFPRRRYPCDECPIRADNADNAASQFPAERWKTLTVSVVDPVTGLGPAWDAPMFGCHKGAPGSGMDLACAGWLARFGADHPLVRLAVCTGRLPKTALNPGESWPPLHDTWSDVIQRQTLPE